MEPWQLFTNQRYEKSYNLFIINIIFIIIGVIMKIVIMMINQVYRSVEGCCICKAKSSRWEKHPILINFIIIIIMIIIVMIIMSGNKMQPILKSSST